MITNELFKKLQGQQAELDNFIYETKNIQAPEKLLLEKNIALQVEFNEMTNDLRAIFKYWSNKPNDKEHALEEMVDVIHFMLSISNLLEIKEYNYKKPNKEYDLRVLVLGINNMISRLAVDKQWSKLMDHLLLFASKCDFTLEMIQEEYNRKHQKNYTRQKNGY